MADRYPGYDVLAKRDSPSWNSQTRSVIDARLATDPQAHRFFNEAEWLTVQAICMRIVPQPPERQTPAPLAAMLDEKLQRDERDGYRDARLPPLREAWRCALCAIDAEARTLHGAAFHRIDTQAQIALLEAVQKGEAHAVAWAGMPPQIFFAKRLLHDIVSAYYAHPASWNEIGFGGPAAPRGYVRMNYDRRDPWEAAEAKPGEEERARRENARVG